MKVNQVLTYKTKKDLMKALALVPKNPVSPCVYSEAEADTERQQLKKLNSITLTPDSDKFFRHTVFHAEEDNSNTVQIFIYNFHTYLLYVSNKSQHIWQN